MTWEGFTKIFRDEFIPAVKQERLAQEFLSLKQKIETVTEITKMFHERTLFCPEHISTEHAHVTQYLSHSQTRTAETSGGRWSDFIYNIITIE